MRQSKVATMLNRVVGRPQNMGGGTSINPRPFDGEGFAFFAKILKWGRGGGGISDGPFQ